jgi:hypothetical protein
MSVLIVLKKPYNVSLFSLSLLLLRRGLGACHEERHSELVA